MTDILLKMKDITKEFSGVKALDRVNVDVIRGEIHALCGENGAGKSTLMNVLSGIYPSGAYRGDIIFDGNLCDFKTIRDSEEKGIVIIHQELALIPLLSIAENIFLGNEISKNGVINWRETFLEAEKIMERVGLDSNPNVLISDIGVGKQQLVEIAKAMSKNVKLLILDEPTAALNEDDSENLLNLLQAFKKEGITSIIISHKLKEVTKIADKITIIRDGKSIETLTRNEEDIDESRIIKGMVGRDLSNLYPNVEKKIGDIFFEVKNWNVSDSSMGNRSLIKDVSINVRKGEIVGIAGLMGSGRTELAMSIFGKSYGKNISGELLIDGRKVYLNNVSEAIKNGLAYVTEDRKTNGLILSDSIYHNISLANLDKISQNSIINKNLELDLSGKYVHDLNIKSRSIFQNVENLSGGNQQKVILAKWMLSNPDILFLDEPTRGIDVGAKYEIYTIIQKMAKQGKAIVMISSELPEILGISDRIYTMNSGKITKELINDKNVTQELLMKYMTDEVVGER